MMLYADRWEGTMAIDERARYELHNRLRDVLGEEEATTLMSSLAPQEWQDVATRGDLAELRGEMAELGGQLRTEMAELGGQLRTELAELGGQLRTEMAGQTRTIVFAMIGSNATLVALAFAAARLA